MQENFGGNLKIPMKYLKSLRGNLEEDLVKIKTIPVQM